MSGHAASSPLRAGRTYSAAIGTLLAVLLAVLLPSGTARAHTDFESSNPADGAVIEQPVDVVTIVFTAAAEPAGEGFVALDQGVVRAPTEVFEVDDRTFELRFDPALSAGEVGIRWSVRAGDAHPISGAFSFTVDAPVAAPTTTTAATMPATTTIPSTPESSSTATPATTATTTPTSTTPVASADADAGGAAPVSLDEFLDTTGTSPDDTAGAIGRVVTLLAATLGLGALAFAATALRGSRGEVAAAIIAIRVAGGVVALGALIEFVGLTSSTGDSVTDMLATSAGLATALRFVGGVALAVGLLTSPRTVPTRRALSAAVLDDASSATDDATDTTWRWTPDRRSTIAFVGAAAILVSFWFDGHTVTEGWRPLHALVDTVHVGAGSIWVGGVVTMAALLWARRRAGRTAGAAELVVRFSPIATVALLAVAAAGLAMAAMVLDSPGDLFSTEWGQVLLLKTVGVAIAAAIGAFNHFALRPALDRDPGSPQLADRLRTSITAEAVILLFVVVVTAALVAASTL